jgi:hypothetical protein
MAALGTRTLVLTIGGTDYTAQVSRAVITSGEADSDFVTFADAALGGKREYRLEFTAVQDMATTTLWDKVWSSAGTSVAFLLKPYGNAAASTTQPHYSGNATITEPDGDFIGGEADASVTARQTIECSWVLDAKPTKVTV